MAQRLHSRPHPFELHQGADNEYCKLNGYRGLFYSKTSTISDPLLDTDTRECALIDSVLDFHLKSGSTCTASADKLVARVHELSVNVRWLLETHAHADHLSAAPYLQAEARRADRHRRAHRSACSRCSVSLQRRARFRTRRQPVRPPVRRWRDVQYRRLTASRHAYAGPHAGLHDLCHRATAETAAFVGDTLFMPDYGTARCDFPGGDASALSLDPQRAVRCRRRRGCSCATTTSPAGREVQFVSTVAAQRAANVHVRDGIERRRVRRHAHRARRQTLAMPR